MTVGLYTHPDCTRHVQPSHPERPERLVAVMERLRQSGLAGSMDNRLADPISDEQLSLVHPGDYVAAINESAPSEQTIRLDPDTYMSPGSLRAAKLAAGACVQATEAVLSGAINKAFCAVRPPGHHAEIATAMGFCIFNNVAIAAETALASNDVKRVAILDFDVHHCNGTVDIFKDRADILVCSSFQENFYPYRYLDYTSDHIVNTPLAAGTIGRDFQRRVEAEWFPTIESFSPDLILISAGFDAHELDPIAQLSLQESDYQWITRRIVEIADHCCEGRIVSTLEGGYNLEALAASVEVHVEELL